MSYNSISFMTCCFETCLISAATLLTGDALAHQVGRGLFAGKTDLLRERIYDYEIDILGMRERENMIMKLIFWKNSAIELAVAATSMAPSARSYASAIQTTHTCELNVKLYLHIVPRIPVNTKHSIYQKSLFSFVSLVLFYSVDCILLLLKMVGFAKAGDCWFGGRLFRLATYFVLPKKQLHRG